MVKLSGSGPQVPPGGLFALAASYMAKSWKVKTKHILKKKCREFVAAGYVNEVREDSDRK